MRTQLTAIVLTAALSSAGTALAVQMSNPAPVSAQGSDRAVVSQLKTLNRTTTTGLRRIHRAIGISPDYAGLRLEVHRDVQDVVTKVGGELDRLRSDAARTCRALGGTVTACPSGL